MVKCTAFVERQISRETVIDVVYIQAAQGDDNKQGPTATRITARVDTFSPSSVYAKRSTAHIKARSAQESGSFHRGDEAIRTRDTCKFSTIQRYAICRLKFFRSDIVPTQLLHVTTMDPSPISHRSLIVLFLRSHEQRQDLVSRRKRHCLCALTSTPSSNIPLL